MELLNNAHVDIVNYNGRDGLEHQALQLFIKTSQGIWSSRYIFPTALEIELIKQAINPMNAVYSN